LPTAACTVEHTCLAETDNAGASRFGLRVADFAFTSPTSLFSWIAGEAFPPNLPACLAAGDGLSSWLLRFDLTAGTLTMGGATAPSDPAASYTFLDTMVPQGGTTYHVAPVTFGLTQAADGSFATSAPQDLDFPMFTSASPTTPAVLSFHSVRAEGLVLSHGNDCIGQYQPGSAAADGTCTNPSFTHAGTLDAFIDLEEADAMEIPGLHATLCVLFATSDTYVDQTQPVAHCKRTGGVIDFKGDWCSATNAPADASCATAVKFSADVAASAVAITP
jgi:hypothetical protein